MAEDTGTTIRCDRHKCDNHVFGVTPKEARERADGWGWTRAEDDRDFCPTCTDIRARRTPLAELVPDGVRLMRPLEACEAAGWKLLSSDEETGASRYECCGREVEYSWFVGCPYGARCKVCGTAVADLLAPSFGNSTVAFADADKVDTEDPVSWVLVSEFNAARARKKTEEADHA